MKELDFDAHHLRSIVRKRLEKEFDQFKYFEKEDCLLVEKPTGGKVIIKVATDGFKIIPITKKQSFWKMALLMAIIIQILALGIGGLPKIATAIAAFISIMIAVSLVAKFTSKYNQNKYLAERIEEYLKKDMLTIG